MSNGSGERGPEHSICAHGAQVQGAQGQQVSVGVERVLYEAATDPEFRRALEQDRDAALAAHGIRLKPSEQAVLANVSDPVLGSMIDSMRVPDHRRRKFIKAVAAASVGAAGLAFVEGCDPASKGARPDEDAGADAATADAATADAATADAATGDAANLDASPDAELPGADSTVDASVLDDAGMSWGSRPPLPDDEE